MKRKSPEILKIKELEKIIEQQSKMIEALEEEITELRYRPGGVGYYEAKENFEERQ